eukprot:758726-Hanusia_phi.AAC.1
MPPLLGAISSEPSLSSGLRAVNFLTTKEGDQTVVTLTYDSPPPSSWSDSAKLVLLLLHVEVVMMLVLVLDGCALVGRELQRVGEVEGKFAAGGKQLCDGEAPIRRREGSSIQAGEGEGVKEEK